MRALLQRVAQARVEIDGEVAGRIETGFLVLLGVARGDGDADIRVLVDKIRHLRVFPDDRGRMNLDIAQAGGAVLCVSQFTLLADCSKGRRPGFSAAEDPERARALWEAFCERLGQAGLEVARGRFGADMRVHLVNDGPVTLWLDSRDD
jgi:D-tyrosyl-tRNA(Tyr) deacylase